MKQPRIAWKFILSLALIIVGSGIVSPASADRPIPGGEDAEVHPEGVVTVGDLPTNGPPAPTREKEKPHRAPNSEALNGTKAGPSPCRSASRPTSPRLTLPDSSSGKIRVEIFGLAHAEGDHDKMVWAYHAKRNAFEVGSVRLLDRLLRQRTEHRTELDRTSTDMHRFSVGPVTLPSAELVDSVQDIQPIGRRHRQEHVGIRGGDWLRVAHLGGPIRRNRRSRQLRASR
jgi:hypothetical protein